MALIRTFSMMLGEMDFVGMYVQPLHKDELLFPVPAFLILALFMILMPILLMNLLIGLAVGDIESVRRNAQLKRLAMQVVLHTELERKLPAVWLEKVDKLELKEYPNDTKCKLGFMDSVLRKWFCNPFTDEGKAGLEIMLDTNEDFMFNEIDKQKRKLREISVALEQQHQLLRLIVQVGGKDHLNGMSSILIVPPLLQKMEIKTEADDVDEGTPMTDIMRPTSGGVGAVTRWTSPRNRKKLRA